MIIPNMWKNKKMFQTTNQPARSSFFPKPDVPFACPSHTRGRQGAPLLVSLTKTGSMACSTPSQKKIGKQNATKVLMNYFSIFSGDY